MRKTKRRTETAWMIVAVEMAMLFSLLFLTATLTCLFGFDGETIL
jgi:hypothetical protein